MISQLFTDHWTFHPADDRVGTAVRLPHDAMIGETRSADAGTGNHGGYFPGGRYVYRRQWTAPRDAGDRRYRLRFEGVYGDTRVLAGGREIARSQSPYREFTAPLDGISAGTSVLIEVDVDNSHVPGSRWYTGSGIYRPVWLESVSPVEFSRDGVHVLTHAIGAGADGNEALVDVVVQLDGDVPDGATVSAELSDSGRIAASGDTVAASGTAELRLTVPDARLWSADHPNLYDLNVRVHADGTVLAERHERTGLRTLDVDARRGLRINGQPVLLRGTAVHHDNGPLGAATFAAAERRRAKLLKDAGYNAIRSAHNPLSRAFLDACDELGLYVMDELTDVWFRPKTPHDESSRFRAEWPIDAADMITKDRNRPSVIMYSIGNEIAESATAAGVEVARDIQAYFAEHDPTRPTTIAVNPLLAMMASRSGQKDEAGELPPERKPATSTAANQAAAKMGRLMVLASTLPAADRATRDVFSVVDIAGYNYGYASYKGARRRYPDRVIVGTESMPGDLPAIWKRVTSVPGVIGDFSWTGWDYLGEVGLGYWSYGSEQGGIAKPYPGVLAGCGVFDITGTPGAALMLAQAVWGITDDPGVAVRPVDRASERPNKTPWLASDAVASWSWHRCTGTTEVEVYSAHDRVELVLNGRSLGRRRAGAAAGFVARFRVPYEAGELVAIAYQAGREVGRTALRTANDLRLQLRAESNRLSGPDDLAFVWVELADDDGTVDFATEDEVTVTVTGAGTLVALASAAPETTGTFTDAVHHTHRGRALAIVRGGDTDGPTTVRATSTGHGEAVLTLQTSLGTEAPELDLAPVAAHNRRDAL